MKRFYCPDCGKFKFRIQVKEMTSAGPFCVFVLGYMCKSCGCKKVQKVKDVIAKLIDKTLEE